MPHMSKLLTLAAVLMSLPCSALGQGFEGEIKTRTISVGHMTLEQLELTTPEQVFALPVERILALKADPDAGYDVGVEEGVFSVKGSLLRAEAPLATGTDPADKWYWVVDVQSGSSFMIQPSRRRYVAFTDEAKPGQTPSAAKAAAQRGPRPRPLGARTIEGIRTTGYEVRTESEIARGWVTEQGDLVGVARGLQSFSEKMVEQVGGQLEMDAEDLLLVQGFPMLVQTLEVTEDEIGDYEIMEIVSVERKSLPASLFAVPAGYQKVTWEQLAQEAIR